jgi:hypothetical protein
VTENKERTFVSQSDRMTDKLDTKEHELFMTIGYLPSTSQYVRGVMRSLDLRDRQM